MDLWELTAREEIRELVASYAHHADRGRFADLCALFVPDGVLEVEGEPPSVGSDAILAFLGGVSEHLASETTVPLIRHYTANLSIAVTSATDARADCYFLVVTEHGVDHWGRYRDHYTCADGAWKFAHRRVRTDGRTPGGWADRRLAGL